MRYLFVFSDTQIEEIYPLEQQDIYIGREQTNTIVINNRTVSSLHARLILQESGEYLLEDLMSTRGTIVNTTEIFSKKTLKVNDVIHFGKVKTFYSDSSDKESALRKVFSSSRNEFLNNEIRSFVKTNNEEADIMASGTINDKIANTMNDLFILYEISNTINSFFDIKEVFQYILNKIDELFHVQKAMIILNKEEGFVVEQCLNSDMEFNSEIIQKAIENKKVTVSNITEKKSEKNYESISRTVSIVVSPLISAEEVLGMIYFETEKNYFTRKNISLINAVSSQLSIVLEKEKLMLKITSNAKMRKEIEIAHSIQSDLLPSAQTFVPGVDLFSFHSFAENVGGDNYYMYKLSEHSYLMFILDAAGKGMQGALLSMMVKSSLRAAALYNHNISEIMNICNNVLYDEFHQSPDKQMNLYATLFLCIYNTQTHYLTWSNAGHEYPFIVRDNSVESLEQSGFPLGWIRDAEYTEYSTKLEDNDLLLLFSDGLIEIESKELWDESVVIHHLKEMHFQESKTIVNRLISTLNDQTAENKQSDDITVIALKKLGDDKSFSTSISSDTETFKSTVTEIEKFLENNSFSQEYIDTVMIAVYEAGINAIKHGNHSDPQKKVSIMINVLETTVNICITDQGKGFSYTESKDDTMKQMIHDERSSGRGIKIIEQCCSSYYYYVEQNEFHFIMICPIH